MSSRNAKRRNSASLKDESKPKRAKPNDEPAVFEWEDKGTIQPDGSVEHNRLEVTMGKDSFIIMVGDSILLRNQDTVRTDDAPSRGAYVARVEKMWQGLPKKRGVPAKMMLQARWYFKKEDLKALKGNFIGPISREELLTKMKDHDLILSNQSDDNDVESIMSRCTVVARKPGPEDPPEAPEEMFVSSYRINFEGRTGAIELKAYDGPDEPWPIFDPEDYEDDTSAAASVESVPVRDLTMTASSGREPKMEVKKNKDPVGPKYIPRNRITQSPSMSDGSKALKTRPSTMSDSASSSSSTSPSPTSGDEASLDFSQDDDEMGQATEGSTTNGRIWIGSEHQVDVPPFTPGQKAVSRNPTLVWKPGSVPDEILDGYLNDASKFLNEFMQKNGLVVDDPYAPLPSARKEALVQAENNGKPMTLSRLSTASTLSTPRNELTRECKIDELLTALQHHHYNPKEALSYVAAYPRDFLTIWTQKERDVFDATFRRHSGSLRMISKALSGSKTFKDVVDYHYRFKIPDQFRRYQEKKREQAVRMMECIETRRSLEAPIYQRDEAVAELRKRAAAKKKDEEWNKTSASDVIGAVEERRASAKELFLQVQNDLGSDALNELAAAVKSVKDGEIEDVRDTFVEVLNDHPDLLDRFLAFLPKRYRGVSPRSGDMDVF